MNPFKPCFNYHSRVAVFTETFKVSCREEVRCSRESERLWSCRSDEIQALELPEHLQV